MHNNLIIFISDTEPGGGGTKIFVSEAAGDRGRGEPVWTNRQRRKTFFHSGPQHGFGLYRFKFKIIKSVGGNARKKSAAASTSEILQFDINKISN